MALNKCCFCLAASFCSLWCYAQTPEECDECSQRIYNDPNGMVQRYMQNCKNEMASCYMANYVLLKLSFKYCSPCFKGEELKMYQEKLAQVEQSIRDLNSDLPEIIGDYTYHFKNANNYHTENRVQNNAIFSSDNSSVYNANSEGDNLAKKLEKLQSSSGFNIETIKPSQERDLIFNKAKVDESSSPIDKAMVNKSQLKTQLENAKSSSNQRIVLKIGEALKKNKKQCENPRAITYTVGAGLSRELSKHSFDGVIPWSEWIAIHGTSLQIRFSKKKKCKEPEFHVTTDREKNLEFVHEASDQFFDYGFFQLRNVGGNLVSGKFTYESMIDDAPNYIGHEGFYLEPGETAEEELGNWYIGCELLSIKIDEYCTHLK